MPLPLPAPTRTNVQRLALTNLVVNIGIVVTGGAVRLTGSGLGCKQWPACNDGNIIPHGAAPVHTYIEFINRTLTFVLAAVALLTWLVVRRLDPPRPDLTRLSFMVGLGIVGQAVLGGFTVLTGLNPYYVMAHLMLSMVLIYWCAVLYNRARLLDRQPTDYASAPLHWLARLILGASYLAMAFGTFTTGAGPHSGDPEAGRTGFDPALIAQLHADSVFLLLGASLAVAVVAGFLRSAPLRRAAVGLLAVELAQGVIGYTQYFTNLPLVLVGIHLAMAAVLMAVATFVAEELRYVRFGRGQRDEIRGEEAVAVLT